MRVALASLGAVAATVVASCQSVCVVLGPGHGGPSGFVTAGQRSALAVTAAVLVVGATAVAVLVRRGRRSRTWRWAVGVWLGSSTALAGGLTGVLLEPQLTRPLALVCVVEALAGLALGVAELLSVVPADGGHPCSSQGERDSRRRCGSACAGCGRSRDR